MDSLFKFELPTLYARGERGDVLTWEIQVEGNKYRTLSGQINGKKNTSAWSVAEAKNVGQRNATTPEQQAVSEAEAKWKKKLKSGGYWENINDINKALKFIEPMLAHPLISKKTDKKSGKTIIVDRTPKVKLPVMVDRKYNGMRQIISINGPFSRKGEPILAAPHIWNALEQLVEKTPTLVLDGELYNHEYRYKLNELISIVRTTADHKITPELLDKSERIVRYYVYDGYGFKTESGVEITENTPNKERREALKDFLKNIPYIVVVPYFMKNTMEEARSLYGEFIEDGYEGAILRNPTAPYQHVRTDDLIKLKPYEDMEVIILDIIDPISGNWGGTGKTASVKMDNEKIFTATFKGTKETLTKILKEKNNWIGQKVTMTYNGWTGKGTPNYGQIDPNNCAVGDR